MDKPENNEPEFSPASAEDALEQRSIKNKVASGLLIGSAITALAFQQSPGNEAVRAMAAFSALDRTDNAVAVASVVGGLTMAIEGGTSSLMALGLHRKKEAVSRIISKFKKNKDADYLQTENKNTLSGRVADVGIALGIGPGIVMMKHHIKEKDPTLRSDIARGLGFSALGATVSAGIGYLIAGGVQQAEKVGLGRQAEYVVEYGSDWKFWAGLFIGGYALAKGYEKTKTFIQRRRNGNVTD